jgi:hypothetical protein
MTGEIAGCVRVTVNVGGNDAVDVSPTNYYAKGHTTFVNTYKIENNG